MRVTSSPSPVAPAPLPPAPKGPQATPSEPSAPPDSFESSYRGLGTGIAVGTVAAAGLGYLGMQVGADLGMKAAIGAFGNNPLALAASVIVPGIPYLIFGSALGMAAGVAAGTAAGVGTGYLIHNHHN